MRIRIVVLFAALLALLTLLTWLLVGGSGPAPGAPGDGGRRVDDSATAASRAPADGGDADPDGATAVRTAAAAGPGVEAAREPDREHELFGVVLDVDGAPRSGADVRVERRPGDEWSLLDAGHNRQAEQVAAGVTDTDGTFRFTIPPGVPHRLEVAAAGRPVERVADCYAGQRVVVRLREGAGVEVSVLRATDRSPLAGVQVRGYRRVGGETGNVVTLFDGRTDQSGTPRAPRAPPGRSRLDVFADRGGGATPRDADLELRAGETLRHEVLLDPGSPVRGRVVDARTGAGIAGARVGEGWRASKAVKSDRDGRFVYPEFSDGYASLTAVAEGYGRQTLEVRSWNAGESRELRTDVEFRLEPGRRAVGRVVGPDARPVAGAYVAAVSYESPDTGADRLDWRATTSGADGEFEIDDLRRDTVHTLFVKRAGHGSVCYAFPPSEALVEVVELGDVPLAPASTIAGRVVDQSGDGIARLVVEAFGHNADRWRFGRVAESGYRMIDGYIAKRSATTDDLGRFAFVDLAPGRYVLRTHLPSAHHQMVQREVSVGPRERLSDVDLVLQRGLSIRGRIEVDDGGTLPKVYVSVDPADGSTTAADAEVRADGTFEAVGLQPGAYDLTAYPYPNEGDRRTGRRFPSTKVEGVAAGGPEVVIRLQRQRDDR